MAPSAHVRLPVSSTLTLHGLLRAGSVDPCFSIREIDIKLLRRNSRGCVAALPVAAGGSSKILSSGSGGGGGSSSPHSKGVSSSNANEQAARVKARQLMMAYSPVLFDATKDEINWLKQHGVLGKRAPKSSLMPAPELMQLLKHNQRVELATQIQAALDKWKAKRASSAVAAAAADEENVVGPEESPLPPTAPTDDGMEIGDANDEEVGDAGGFRRRGRGRR